MSGVKVLELNPETQAIDMVEGGMVIDKEASIILCGCWAIQSEHNARNHGEKGRDVMDSVRQAIDIAMDLAMPSKKVTVQPDKTKNIKWKP